MTADTPRPTIRFTAPCDTCADREVPWRSVLHTVPSPYQHLTTTVPIAICDHPHPELAA